MFWSYLSIETFVLRSSLLRYIWLIREVLIIGWINWSGNWNVWILKGHIRLTVGWNIWESSISLERRLWVWELLTIELGIIMSWRIGIRLGIPLKSIGVRRSIGLIGLHFWEKLLDILGFIFEEMHWLDESKYL